MSFRDSSIAVGIDLATASARAHAVRVDTGDVLAIAERALPAPRVEGGVRVQAADYASAAAGVLEQLAADLGARGGEVAAISVTGTSGTVVPVGPDGAARGDAIMYDDASTAALDRVLAESGVSGSVSMLPRMQAALARAPEATSIASTADVVLAWLAGHAVPIDSSHALKAGIDPAARRWNTAAAETIGLDTAVLPEIVRPGAVLGEAVRGPFPGALLVAGMTDGCTSQIATGAVGPGASVGILGTTLVWKTGLATLPAQLPDGVYAHLSPDGVWWPGAASNVGGGALAALVPDFPGWDDAAEQAIAHAPAVAPVYPLAAARERFPARDAQAAFATTRGLAGLDAATRARAVLEGVALVERWGLDVLGATDASEHVVSGGGTRSALWNRTRASALGRPVRIARTRDSGFGAAVLATTAITHESLADAASRLSRSDAVVDPDPDLARVLADHYAALRAELDAAGLDSAELDSAALDAAALDAAALDAAEFDSAELGSPELDSPERNLPA
ncbi:FGGY-family carbohydrate kinase [uncultured Microbacterium sp.]|uniref:FGGY-family carbohydrate kinase n=1 Tax=uncultured Microbacterium sp. TaxID=191216 RepID=UPI0025FABE04|nr:FGGY-family carbohydrate kinase [uncultured Microbacterium sp.]